MSQSVEELYRFGLKLFVPPGTSIEVRDCIPIFHRWIQTGALDELLIDVADYTHLVNGPSVLLVGYSGNVSFDSGESRLGLICTRKRPESGSFVERLTGLARTLLTAGKLLESDPKFDGQLRFMSNQLQFVSNDRLVAPPGDASVAALTPALRIVMETLYPGQPHDISSTQPSKERLAIALTARKSVPLLTLLDRASETTSRK